MHNSADATTERLIGTWRLISATREDLASGERVEQLGANPSGYLVYAADGRMSAIIARGDRVKPAGAVATPEEAAALMRSMVSYAGRYTIDGAEITHHVDISWNESWTGTRQTRIFRLEGEHLHLSTRPSPNPADGTMSVRHMVWEKVK